MPWAELPAADKSLTEICHIITDVARTSEGYYPRNYTMGYDKAKRLALWAAYPLHSCYTQGISRERHWGYDPTLAPGEQMTGGVSAPYNRGHTSIAQDYISTIYESKDGTIWIGTYSEGLCAFSKQTGCFTHYRKETDGRNCISDNSIDAITEDSYGTLWLGTVSSGLDRFDRSTGRFTNYDDRNGEGRLQRIHCLAERAPGELLVCANSGATLYRISESELRPIEDTEVPFMRTKCCNIFSCYATRKNDSSDRGKVVSAVCELKDGQYLLGNENDGILLFDRHAGMVVPYRTAQNVGTAIYNVFSMLVDDQTLWIAAFQRGIEAVDLKSRTVKSYLADPSDPSSRVFVLFRSSSGRIWAVLFLLRRTKIRRNGSTSASSPIITRR